MQRNGHQMKITPDKWHRCIEKGSTDVIGTM